MFNRDDAIKVVKSCIDDCQKSNINFKKVILFGSTARNEAREDSDICCLGIRYLFL